MAFSGQIRCPEPCEAGLSDNCNPVKTICNKEKSNDRDKKIDQ
jgi:hypothetical protein